MTAPWLVWLLLCVKLRAINWQEKCWSSSEYDGIICRIIYRIIDACRPSVRSLTLAAAAVVGSLTYVVVVLQPLVLRKLFSCAVLGYSAGQFLM